MLETPCSSSPSNQHLAALQAKLSRLSTSCARTRHLTLLLATAALFLSFSKLCGREVLCWLMVPVGLLAWLDAYYSNLRQVFTARYDGFLKKLVAANGQGRIKEEDVPTLAVPEGLPQVFLTLKALLSVAILPFYGGLLLTLLVLGNGWDQSSPARATKGAHAGCGGACGSSGGSGCASGGCGSGSGGCGGSCGSSKTRSNAPKTTPTPKPVMVMPAPRPNAVPVTTVQPARPATTTPVPTATLTPAAPQPAPPSSSLAPSPGAPTTPGPQLVPQPSAAQPSSPTQAPVTPAPGPASPPPVSNDKTEKP